MLEGEPDGYVYRLYYNVYGTDNDGLITLVGTGDELFTNVNLESMQALANEVSEREHTNVRLTRRLPVPPWEEVPIR